MNRIVHIIKATGIAGAEQHLITMLPEFDKRSFDIYGRKIHYMKLVSLLFTTSFICHWLACVYYIVAEYEI